MDVQEMCGPDSKGNKFQAPPLKGKDKKRGREGRKDYENLHENIVTVGYNI
jgi:hypothetical protein